MRELKKGCAVCCEPLSNAGKASQSLRPQAQMKFDLFSAAACTSPKILLGLQTCEWYAEGVP